MSSTATLAELMLLGSNSSFDPSKLATSTIQSIISHINTLKRNNIDINEQALTIDTEQMLNRLRDTRGNLLSNTYKRQIGMTIKRLFPNADISLNQYNQAHNLARVGKGTRTSSEEFMKNVRLVRDATLTIVGDVYSQGRIEDLGQYDACLATLLTLCTSLRVEEVRHLKLSHIPKIRANQPIGIKSKMSYNTRVIANNNLLEATFTAIETQRPYVIMMINTKKSDYASQYHQLRLKNDYIILSTADYMRKKLHEIAAACGAKFDSLGFTVFRKLTTSVLIEGGGFLTAQTMNNHSSLNTTLDHYNVMTSKSVQMTYDSLAENELNNIEPSNVDDIRRQYENIKQKLPTTTSTATSTSVSSTNVKNVKRPPPTTTSTSQQPTIPSTSSMTTTTSPQPVQNIAEMLQLKNELLELRNHQRNVEEKVNSELNRLPQQIEQRLTELRNHQITVDEKVNNELTRLPQQFDQRFDALHKHQRSVEEKLESELNRLPQHVEQQIDRVRNQVTAKLEEEFRTASQIIEDDIKQIHMLRDTLNNKLMELQEFGVQRSTLDELNAEFQAKINNLEKACMSTEQLREEFDRRLVNIERLTAKIPKATDDEKFKRLESRLQSNMTTNLTMRTESIGKEIAKLNQDLNNLRELFGVEHDRNQNQLDELHKQTRNTVIKQIEHDQLFQTITDELDSLRRLIIDRQPKQETTGATATTLPLSRQILSRFRPSAPQQPQPSPPQERRRIQSSAKKRRIASQYDFPLPPFIAQPQPPQVTLAPPQPSPQYENDVNLEPEDDDADLYL